MTLTLVAAFLAAQVFPPALPGGKEVVTETSEEFLKPPEGFKSGADIAKAAPTVDFMVYPGQDYAGKPWSVWGDGVVARGKFYSAIGDHLAPAGNAFVYEYDPEARRLRRLLDVRKILNLPDGHYTPGKIHSRLDFGSDGKLYFSTHRGSTRVTTDQYHYKGDWILRHDPVGGTSEIVACGPVPKHCIPTSVLDPDRLIFYGGTAPGGEGDAIQFFAWDAKGGKLLYSGPDGPARYLLFAKSTGKVYWVGGKEDMIGPLSRWDPAQGGAPVKLKAELGLRAATQETPQGIVYTVSKGGRGTPSTIYAFNTKTEEVETLGEAAVGIQTYITTIDADPSGRYLYYMPGAHGGSEKDGSPIVQFDVKTRRRKVIAFLHPCLSTKYGIAPVGTFGSAIDEKGEKLFVVWNSNRGGKVWDCVTLTVIHIPASERPL